jgi:hypothetical protein
VPEVKVTHRDLKSDDAKTAPKRTPVPPGIYHALIMSASLKMTKGSPPLQKLSVEFQLLFGVGEEGSTEHDETHQGRRVYQDYILEDDERWPDISAQRRYELRQLLDATEIAFTDTGFNSDHLINKNVVITVRHRKSDQQDEDGNYRVFTNVVKVDTAEAVDSADLV